jgi:hypothetical protein
MSHYVPASLQNITKVIEYLLDKKNRRQMKAIVNSANSWCKRTITKEQLQRDAISQLKKYETSLNHMYNVRWVDEWNNVKRRIMNIIGDDLVDFS